MMSYQLHPNVSNIVLTEELKLEVFQKLATVSTDTLLGIAYRNFSSDANPRSKQDFEELLYDMFLELQQNPRVIKTVLGPSFDFFYRLLYHDTDVCDAKLGSSNKLLNVIKP